MFLRCCLLHITIIIMRRILYLEHLFPRLGLVLFMSYLCDLFFIFSISFIITNHIISSKQSNLFFAYFFEYLILIFEDNINEQTEEFSKSKSSASGCCLAFAWFFASFSLALLIKVMLIKKACISINIHLLVGTFRTLSKSHYYKIYYA